MRRRRRVSTHPWSGITPTLIPSESAFGEEFPPCWAPVIRSHDCTKATNQSLSSWYQEKFINTQFLLCVSIRCCCVPRCNLDAAINLPSHLVLLHMFTLNQAWLDCGGHDSWSRSLQPCSPHTQSIDFILFFLWNVKQLAFSVDSVYPIRPQCFFENVEQIDALTQGWRPWKPQPCCGCNRGKELIDIFWQFLISISSETERGLFCCSGGSV